MWIFLKLSGLILVGAGLLACGEDVRTEKFPSGQIRLSTPYEKEQKHGTETRYFAEGSVQTLTPYVHGQIHGTVQDFHPNGEVRSLQSYVQGVQEGEAQWFHDNKVLAKSILFAQGKAVSFPQEFDRWGKPATHGQFKDARDGRSYEWIRIGEQVWTAQNLAYPTVQGSLCLQCDNWGRLYNLDAANYACPEFFHLPSTAEWQTLIAAVGNDPAAQLKAGWGWDPLGNGLYGNGKDAFGFGALAGGGHFAPADVAKEKRVFQDAGRRAYFWTRQGERVALDFRSPRVQIEKVPSSHAYSVRCLLNDSP